MFLVVEEIKVNIPGDERSRTNPGHGYPACVETYEKVKEFSTEAELKTYLMRYMQGRNAFRVYSASPVSVGFETTVNVHLEHNPPDKKTPAY